MKLSVTDTKTGISASIDLPLPLDLDELAARFGEDAIAHAAREQIAHQAKNTMRYLLRKGETQADISISMANWRPFHRLSRSSYRRGLS